MLHCDDSPAAQASRRRGQTSPGAFVQIEALGGHMSIRHTIQERSYLIWEREGRPHGRNLEHWVMAEAELSAEQVEPKAAAAKSAASPKAAVKSAAKTSSPRKR
jgi:hypothetical protein